MSNRHFPLNSIIKPAVHIGFFHAALPRDTDEKTSVSRKESAAPFSLNPLRKKNPSTSRISTHPSFPSPSLTARRRLKKGEIFSLSSFGKEGGPPPQAAYYARRKRSLATHFFLRQRTRKKEICIKKISRILDGNSARERRSNERPQLRILYKLCSIIKKLIFPTLSA